MSSEPDSLQLRVLRRGFFRDGDVGVGVFGLAGVQPQKLSTIQTLLPTVGAGIATYFPLCEGMAQVAWKFFTCQSECAFPIKSTYNRVDRRPVGLLETKKPFPSAAQSREVKLFQPFTVIWRVGCPLSEITRIRLSLALNLRAAMEVPSGERPQVHPFAGSSSFATSRGLPFTESNTEKMNCFGSPLLNTQMLAGACEHW